MKGDFVYGKDSEVYCNIFKSREMNRNYEMKFSEWIALANSEQERIDVVATAFDFGYAKGYRSALSEMRKVGMKNG